LPLAREIPTDLRLQDLLLVGVVGLIAAVCHYDAEKARSAGAIVTTFPVIGPMVLAQASSVIRRRIPLDLLFEPGYEGPLVVFGRVVVNGGVESGPKLG